MPGDPGGIVSVLTPVSLGISLGLGCSPECDGFAGPLLLQMGSGKYDVCATMSLPKTVEQWQEGHRTARKRAWRADRAGYGFARIHPQAWSDDIHGVNISRGYRQGRPMTEGYQHPPEFGEESYPCKLHAVRRYAVLAPDHHLVAYLWMYRAGDLALVSQVLGHADHEPNGVMQLLFREALMAESRVAPGVCVYNRWDSGTDGLRQAKAWVGFEETAVEWLP